MCIYLYCIISCGYVLTVAAVPVVNKAVLVFGTILRASFVICKNKIKNRNTVVLVSWVFFSPKFCFLSLSFIMKACSVLCLASAGIRWPE